MEAEAEKIWSKGGKKTQEKVERSKDQGENKLWVRELRAWIIRYI